MSPTDRHDSILMHPALAGRTLVVRRGGAWTAFEIQSGGELGFGRAVDTDPAFHNWRGASAQ